MRRRRARRQPRSRAHLESSPHHVGPSSFDKEAGDLVATDFRDLDGPDRIYRGLRSVDAEHLAQHEERVAKLESERLGIPEIEASEHSEMLAEETQLDEPAHTAGGALAAFYGTIEACDARLHDTVYDARDQLKREATQRRLELLAESTAWDAELTALELPDDSRAPLSLWERELGGLPLGDGV